MFILLALVAGGVAISFSGSLSHARAAHESFVREVAAYEANGISLAEALAEPTVVVRNGNEETIDNPLKHDYLQVGQAIEAVQGPAMISTALDLVTFLLVPLLFLAAGAYLANLDRKARTGSLRAARERWSYVTGGKLLALAGLSIALPIAVVLFALVAGAAGARAVSRLSSEIDYALVSPEPAAPLLPQLLTTAAVAFFFGILGYAMGYLTRSYSWPLVLSAAALFMLPFVAWWDPRNLLAVVGSEVYSFWGQFKLRPPLELPVSNALVLLLGYAAVALGAIFVSARSVRLR